MRKNKFRRNGISIGPQKVSGLRGCLPLCKIFSLEKNTCSTHTDFSCFITDPFGKLSLKIKVISSWDLTDSLSIGMRGVTLQLKVKVILNIGQ